MFFDIIYTDPPWSYANNLSGRVDMGEKTYNLMSLEELKALKSSIDLIANKDSLMFQWVTLPLLKEGIELIEALGYKFINVPFVWVKTNPTATVIEEYVDGRKMPNLHINGGLYSGLGHYTAGNVELVIMGKRGKGCSRVQKDIKQLVIASETEEIPSEVVVSPRGIHSRKPIQVRERIELLFGPDKKYIEFFAREKYRKNGNWVFCGYEVEDAPLNIFQALEVIAEGLY